jgi:hypothetical protein
VYFICGLTVQNDISRFARRYNICGFHVFHGVPGFSSDHTHLIRFLRVPIRRVSISIAVILRCLLCDQKFTDSLRGKMPMDLRCLRYARGGGQKAQAERQRLTLPPRAANRKLRRGGQAGPCNAPAGSARIRRCTSTSREQNSSPRSSTRILHVSVHQDTQQII